MDQPPYTIRPNVKKILLTKLLLLTGLSVLLYIGARMNLALLKIELTQKLHFIIIACIAIIAILDILLHIIKATKTTYLVFADKVEITDKKHSMLQLRDVQTIVVNRGIIDTWLGTCTIQLAPHFFIKDIPNSNQIYIYLQELIEYAKRS